MSFLNFAKEEVSDTIEARGYMILFIHYDTRRVTFVNTALLESF
jgi:hypothetical protein